jgi:Holliday junction DNA helicase RuvA
MATISSVPGIGKKTAQRLIVELKDKLELEGLAATGGAKVGPAHVEAREALVTMGFASSEASAAVSGYEPGAGTEVSVEEIVRYALKRLGDRR